MPLPEVLRFFQKVHSKRTDLVRTLAADSKRSFWAMADQGVVSLGNFSVNFFLAAYFERSKNLADFGAFWMLMELILFLNGMQAALVVFPLTIRGAVVDATGLGRMTSTSLAMTLLSWPIFATAVIVTSLVGAISLEAGLWAAIAMLQWQFQETLRRALMSQLRFRSALIGDSISYLGQICVVLLFAWSGRLTLVTVFQAMALTSGIASLVQASQLGLRRIKYDEVGVFAADCWKLGRMVLFGNLSNFVTGPIFSWNFAYWCGKTLVGVNYTLTNLVRLANPLSFSIATLIMPNSARALHEEGMRSAKRTMYRFALLGGLMLAPYIGVLVLFPEMVIRLVFRHGAEDLLPYTFALRVAAIGAALAYGGIATGAFLNSVERTRWTFNAQLIAAATVPLVVMPLTAMYDVTGAAIGVSFSAAAQFAAHIYYIRKLPNDVPAHLQLDEAALQADASLGARAA